MSARPDELRAGGFWESEMRVKSPVPLRLKPTVAMVSASPMNSCKAKPTLVEASWWGLQKNLNLLCELVIARDVGAIDTHDNIADRNLDTKGLVGA